MREWVVAIFGLWLLVSVIGVVLSIPFTGWPDLTTAAGIGLIALVVAIAFHSSGHSASSYWRWLRKPPRQGL